MTSLAAGVAFPAETVRRFEAAGRWTAETPQDRLAALAREAADAPAVIGPGRTLSFCDLDAAADRFAGGLLGLGFARGDVIGVQLPNVPEFLVAYHGIERMGGVVALLHMPYRAGELAPLLAHGRARGVICFAGLPGYDARR